MQLERVSVRLYGLLVKLYPTEYKKEFGEEMQFVFSESLHDAVSESGLVGFITIWTRTTLDTVKSISIQYLEARKGRNYMKNRSIITQNKIFAWIALGTGLLLLIPLTAMQFNTGVNWDESDFVVVAALVFGIASIFVLIARVLPRKYWVATGILMALVFVYIYAELAVGIFTNWGS